jgi:hypothetical protein
VVLGRIYCCIPRQPRRPLRLKEWLAGSTAPFHRFASSSFTRSPFLVFRAFDSLSHAINFISIMSLCVLYIFGEESLFFFLYIVV